ncbi:MAG: 2Fe-2S iron-sulfur cluster-binding protein, partial [Oscillospiraceae bacterium]|nr:2Fe-2S iron-sulfur cluster-binding protein [Oscillospiraceae bacterium]
MSVKLRVTSGGSESPIEAEEGTSLLEALLANGYAPPSPCGGKGTCGKCKVRVSYAGGAGDGDPPSPEERDFLGADGLAGGLRLACHAKVSEGMSVVVPYPRSKARIQTMGRGTTVSAEPFVRKEVVAVREPDLEDQSSDMAR